MEYVRINRKACINDIGNRKFEFDYRKELLIYKYLTGERMNSSEWHKVDEYEKFNSYLEWEKSIKKNNKAKTRKQLKEFEHYLNNRINMVMPQKEFHAIMCSAVLTGLITFFLDHIEIFDEIVVEGSPIVSIFIFLIFLVLTMFIIGFVMFKVMMPMWDTSIEKSFLKEYQLIIKKMLKKKVE